MSTQGINRQLYENSPLPYLMADEAPSTAEKFFNQKNPNLAVLHEKPEHRAMLWMKMQGASNRNIAQTCGYSEAWISQLMRQPWARRFLATQLQEQGSDGVSELLKGAAADSVLTLIELRDDEETPKAVRRQSAVDLLDRHFGKPVQRIEQQTDVKMDVNSVNEIDRKLAELDEQEKQLLGRN